MLSPQGLSSWPELLLLQELLWLLVSVLQLLRNHTGLGQPSANDFLFPSPSLPTYPAPTTLGQHCRLRGSSIVRYLSSGFKERRCVQTQSSVSEYFRWCLSCSKLSNIKPPNCRFLAGPWDSTWHTHRVLKGLGKAAASTHLDSSLRSTVSSLLTSGNSLNVWGPTFWSLTWDS